MNKGTVYILSFAIFALSLMTATSCHAITDERDVIRIQLLKYEKLLARSPNNKVLHQNLLDLVADIQYRDLKIKGARLGLKYGPKNHELRLELAETLLEGKKFEEARIEFTYLLKENFKSLDSLLGMASVYEGLKDPKEALKYLQQAKAIDAKSPELWEHLGDDHGWLGQYREAFFAYDKVLVLSKDGEQIDRVKQAIKELKKEELEATSDSSEEVDEDTIPLEVRIANELKVLAKNPNDKVAHVRLGHLYAKGKRFEQAFPEFFIGLTDDKTRYSALVGMGKSYAAIGEETRGLDYLLKATRVDPNQYEAWAQLLRVAVFHENPNLAKKALSMAEKKGIPPEDLAILKGKYLFYRKKYKEAEDTYKAILREIPEETEAMEGLALLALEKKDWEKADGYFQKALRYEPVSTWYLDKRAEIAEIRKRPRLAIELLEEARKLRPTELDRYVWLGRLLNEQGERGRSFDIHARAFEIAPDSPEVLEGFLDCLEMGPLTKGHEELSYLLHEKMARAMAADSQYMEAAEKLEKLSSHYAKVAQDRKGAAGRYSAEAKVDYAKRELELSVAALENEIRIRRVLAELYIDMGDVRATKEQYLRLLELDPSHAQYVLQLAELYHDEGDHKKARDTYRHLPPEKLDLEQRKKRALTFEEAGNRTDAIRQYKRMEKEEHPDDEVLLRLGQWQLARGNYWRARRYFSRALCAASNNKEAYNELRLLHLDDIPDVRLSNSRGTSSDKIEYYERAVEYRTRWNSYMLGFRLGNYEIRDNHAKSSGPDFEIQIANDPERKLQWMLALGQDPRAADSGSNFELRLDWHISDLLDVSGRVFRSGLGETALASENSVQLDGVIMRADVFASTNLNFYIESEMSRLSDDNERTRLEAGGSAKLYEIIPGEVSFKFNRLDYDFQVAPILYYSPQGATGSEFTYRLSKPIRNKLMGSGFFTAGNEDGKGDYRTTGVTANFEMFRNRMITMEYVRHHADRSIHGGGAGYKETDMTFGFNVLY